MRFLSRALSGLLILASTLGLVALSVWWISDTAEKTGGPRPRMAQERSYTVDAAVLKSIRYSPTIVAYGEVKAWRTLEVRAPKAGRIDRLADNFRDGVFVKKGALLLSIEPEASARRVADAEQALAQSKAQLTEAENALTLIRDEIRIMKVPVEVKKRDLERKRSLRRTGAVSQTSLDEAELAVSSAEQALVAKRQAALALERRVAEGKAAVRRAALTLADAKQAAADARYEAPFAGRLAEVTATLGRIVSQNEKLALLIDPTALEVAFKIRDADFGRLLADGTDSELKPLRVSVVMKFGERVVTVEGTLTRAAATSDPAGGRIVYARLDVDEKTPLKPGDFVTVTVHERAIDDAIVISARAATEDGRVLLIGDDGRLKEVRAKILRRQGDELIVAGVPLGARYVTTRLPYLAAGIKVRPRGKDIKPGPEAKRAEPGDGDMVALTPRRRAALIRVVQASKRMPAARKKRLLAMLAKPRVPRRLVARLERAARMSVGR